MKLKTVRKGTFLRLSLFCLVFFSRSLVCFADTKTEPIDLIVKKVPLNVLGREVSVFVIEQPNGTSGLTLSQEDGFHVRVKNDLTVPTSIHWHGLVLPNLQDGVPYVTQNPIQPGETMEFHFPLVQSGTYWMHSHFGLQEQLLASAPLVIHPSHRNGKIDQEITLMLSDFTFTNPIEVLHTLQHPEMRNKNMERMSQQQKRPSLMQKWDSQSARFVSAEIDAAAADIDVRYDALLANRRTLDNPEVVPVAASKVILIRCIAGSSATNFYIDTGKLDAQLIAVDGQDIQPLEGNFFQLGVAQRIDLEVRIPNEGGAFPILARGEGTNQLTGIVLATPNSTIPPLATTDKRIAAPLDNTQEMRLRAKAPLASKPVDRSLPSILGGDMKDYVWLINGKAYPNRDSLDVKEGERVEVVITNQTMMSHPMHLHGHDFQVVEINGNPISGAQRDTVLIPPKSTIKIQFDANNPGIWAYHCHILYHFVTGMFTVVKYNNADTKYWQPEKSQTEVDESISH